MHKLRNFMLPDWFPYDVIMVTRRRYKCAGYHIVQYEREGKYQWTLTIPGHPPGYSVSWDSLSGAVGDLVDEYRRLWREVQSLEVENGKVHT